MITVNEKLNIQPNISYDLFAPKERIVFLDIETTGLNPGNSMLYLIGACGYEDGNWYLHQFFSESKSDEILLTKAFSDYLNNKRKGQDHLILVTYNGDRFDLPYLKEVEKEYSQNGLFMNTVSFDLYKNVKPYKKMLGLPDLTLKTVESFCGISRNDTYSGLELIGVYEEYLRLHYMIKGGCEDTEMNEALKKKCLSCLLLHNAEDIADMLPVMKMLSYKYLFDGDFQLLKAEKIICNGKEVLDLIFNMESALPKELYLETENIVVSASDKSEKKLEITISIIEDDLRHYLKDYKDYYYLPAEDTAIHKSIGEFVDRKNRVKATAETCYIREKGKYIEVPRSFDLFGPVFNRTRKGKCFAKYGDDILLKDKELKLFADRILEEFLLSI